MNFMELINLAQVHQDDLILACFIVLHCYTVIRMWMLSRKYRKLTKLMERAEMKFQQKSHKFVTKRSK